MSCDDVKSRLQEYVTRELTSEGRRRVDEHLLECEECRRELALMSAIVSNLESQPVDEPSPDFSRKLMASLSPQRRQLSPWLSLVLLPVLGGLGYLFRFQLVAGLARVLGWFGIDVGQLAAPHLPQVTSSQLALVPVAVGLVAVVTAATVAGLVWRYYAESA